jgi:D-proline reductase (dithiol) PrdB
MVSHVETGPAYDFERVRADILRVPPSPLPEFEAPRLTPFTVPLEEATIGVLTTCGAYFPDQERLGETEDVSYRLLPRERDLREILIAHRTPIRVFAEADPNVAYPRDRLLELEQEGAIGRLADAAVSMVGSITRYDELALEAAPQIADDFRSMGVDLVLVLAFCPQCHVAAGVLARAIEARGLPTTSIATLQRNVIALKPPRALFLDFPLGCPCGRPGEAEQQRDILRQALRLAASEWPEWELRRLPHAWGEDGDRSWESHVDNLYRLDREIRATVAQHIADHARLGSTLQGHEREFVVRCNC